MRWFLLAALVAPGPAFAQSQVCRPERPAEAPGFVYSAVTRRDVVEGTLERSSFAPARGLSNLPALIFEANLHAHFFLPELKGVIPVFSMASDMRMLDIDSKPVRTPSYQPQLAVHLPLNRCNSFLLRLAHYSNGQEGESVVGDSLNLRDGNFSTNYIEAGPSFTNAYVDGYWSARLTAQVHFNQDSLTAADHGRLRLDGQYVILLAQQGRVGAAIDLRFTARPSSKRFSIAEGMSYSATYLWKPPHFDDFGVYVNAYYGRDYYNIWFAREPLKALRIGVVADARTRSFSRKVPRQ